jgi:hypothetical protein
MTKRKSFKQQLTTIFSLVLVAMTIAVGAADQALASGKVRGQTPPARVTYDTSGKCFSRTAGSPSTQGGRRVIMANTEGDFHVRSRGSRQQPQVGRQ